MENKFVITKYNNITIGCLVRDGKIDDIRCYEENSLIGNIYVAKVSNVLDNINAAFVDIKKDLTCYLPLEDYYGKKPLKVGDELIVQVTKDSIKTKQPAVTTNISLTGEYAVVHCDKTIGVSAKIKGESVRNTLKNTANAAISDFKEKNDGSDIDYGVILRTKCGTLFHDDFYIDNDEKICKKEQLNNGYDFKKLYDDIMSTIEKLDSLLKKAAYLKLYSVVWESEGAYIKDLAGMSEDIGVITDDKAIYDALCKNCGAVSRSVSLHDDESISLNSIYNIPLTIERCLKKKAYLKSGGYLVIEPTEAMTVIDVNSGKSVKGKNSEEELLKINIEAAAEIARQLRLRNLSGIIIIDFISMKSEKNQLLLMDELKKAVRWDYVNINVVDITRLGLVELTRKKVRKPLHEVFS